MRSFQQVIAFLFALCAFALAQSDTIQYDATVYITSTVRRVHTVTLSGSASASLANMTSTIPASHAPAYPTGNTNATSVVLPTGSAGVSPSASQFTGGAAAPTAQAFAAMFAAGLGYLVL